VYADLLVVGGGLAGLIAALRLRPRVVIEASEVARGSDAAIAETDVVDNARRRHDQDSDSPKTEKAVEVCAARHGL
jgi:succinate dehydrogenase/fumarate reductase flavoprotein subunit